MDKIIAAFCAFLSFVAMPAHATDYFTAADMSISPGPGGTYSVSFGQTGLPSGPFQHVWQFVLPWNGLASGSITTSAVVFEGIDDTDLITVTFNTIPLFGITGALNEVVFANAVPIIGGFLNTIVIDGLSRGNGSYGAQGVYVPMVPEPASWALMLTGIGIVGAAMRRRVRIAFT